MPTLPDSTLETFRSQAFHPAQPALFPKNTFSYFPAIRKWFVQRDHESSSTTNPTTTTTTTINRTYLSRYGSTLVPLEISNDDLFTRSQHSLSFFLSCVHASSSTYLSTPTRYFSAYIPGVRRIKRTNSANDFFSPTTPQPPPRTKPTARIYLAQAPLADLPGALRADTPTPSLVSDAGKGDVYDSSLWLGEAPTFTPLHRDPNPNLFVQLAGTKIVRLVPPDVGRGIFSRVQQHIGSSAGVSAGTMRGEEMMAGMEKRLLEAEVWDDRVVGENGTVFWQAEVEAGDGLFIPKGWWHSVKGVGRGMTGSVNWWFR